VTTRPAALDRIPESAHVHLDVREDLRAGREPFARIQAAVAGLGPDGVLVLRAPFEPIPLYRALGRRGFAHFAERRAADDWVVWFYHGPEPVAATPSGSAAGPGAGPAAGTGPARDGAAPAAIPAIDVRGLEPPLPMVRVLEAVEALAPRQRLTVLHDRRPLFLYAQLDARGLGHATEEPEPGLVRITIWRAEGGA
jgi:uncharacterized protein (DUF2249 family)